MAFQFTIFILCALCHVEAYTPRPAIVFNDLVSQQRNSQIIKLTWGSCYGQSDYRTDIFKTIGDSTNPPDLFIWGGDVTYTDKFTSFLTQTVTDEESGIQTPDHIREKYRQAKEDYPYYQEMMDLGTKVIGIWDDHDFGINDGDKTFPQKYFTRDIFLDFIDEPEDSIRRTDRNSSIHQDYIIHGKNNFKTHIVLIDNRFDFDKTIFDRLGDQQWQWLEDSIQEHFDADLTLLVTGVQVIKDNSVFEETFQWPSKERLFNLVQKYQKNNVVVLSGDVHYGHRYQTPCDAFTGYTMPEFTSSGMTHTVRTWLPAWIPGTMQWHQDPNYSTEEIMELYNFGEVEIDTENRTATFVIRDMDNNGYFNKTYHLDTGLQFSSEKLLRNRRLCESVQKDAQYVMFVIMSIKGVLAAFLDHHRGLNEVPSFYLGLGLWPYSWTFKTSDRLWWIFVWQVLSYSFWIILFQRIAFSLIKLVLWIVTCVLRSVNLKLKTEKIKGK